MSVLPQAPTLLIKLVIPRDLLCVHQYMSYIAHNVSYDTRTLCLADFLDRNDISQPFQAFPLPALHSYMVERLHLAALTDSPALVRNL